MACGRAAHPQYDCIWAGFSGQKLHSLVMSHPVDDGEGDGGGGEDSDGDVADDGGDDADDGGDCGDNGIEAAGVKVAAAMAKT